MTIERPVKWILPILLWSACVACLKHAAYQADPKPGEVYCRPSEPDEPGDPFWQDDRSRNTCAIVRDVRRGWVKWAPMPRYMMHCGRLREENEHTMARPFERFRLLYEHPPEWVCDVESSR